MPLLLVVLLMLAACTSKSEKPETVAEPSKPKHTAVDDPVQHAYSHALFGFAANQRCNFLDAAERKQYLAELEQANKYFRAYTLAQDIVANDQQYNQYIKGMVEGSSKDAAPLSPSCGQYALDAVQSGQDTIRIFNQQFAAAMDN